MPLLVLVTLGTAACSDDDGLWPCAGRTCGGHGTCEMQDHAGVCVCETGYTGEECTACALGYRPTGDGSCIASDSCASDDPCGDHGTCDDSSGLIACLCDEGWTGELCDACYPGYHDDGAGDCLLDEQCLPTSCAGHGTCDATDGLIACQCDAGYAGEHCEDCAEDFHWDLSGSCVPDQLCDTDECEPNGACAVVGGVKTCVCDAGYTGLTCETCADGFHRDADEACVADQVCGVNDCEPNGSCVVEGGIKACECDAGYAGLACETCAAGFHRDAANACVADTTCQATTCSGHGTCQVIGGVPQCTACDAGYAGAHCELCAPGYRLDGGLCVAIDVCGANECAPNGTCVVKDGLKSCVCNPGYAGADCNDCYPGYEKHLVTGLCEVPCSSYNYMRCDGECVSLQDPENCGTCGNDCGAASCVRTGLTLACVCPEDDPSRKDCGGVCTNITNDPLHCGDCDQPCDTSAGETCFGGHCVVPDTDCGVCYSDQLCCDGSCSYPSNFEWDSANCGFCGNACSPQEICVSGACLLKDDGSACSGTCAEGHLCCNDSCIWAESLLWDTQNCGACGNQCAPGLDCYEGQCQCSYMWWPLITLCDGACVDTQSDLANCGACGVQCQLGQVCASGLCVTETGTFCNDGMGCDPGLSLCCAGSGGEPDQCLPLNQLAEDPANCGGCGIQCPAGEACVEGQCLCNFWPGDYCDGVCVSLLSPEHCGGCNLACGEGFYCSGGYYSAPECTCYGTLCGEVCANISWDERHCGGCDQACDPGEKCLSGHCMAETSTSCNEGEGCDNYSACCDDGMGGGRCLGSYDFYYSTQNCGGCGIQCGVNENCNYGTCLCYGEYCDGVCTLVNWSEEHCGGCGQPCEANEKCLDATCIAETGTDCAFGMGCGEESACCDDGLGGGNCIYYYDLMYDEQNCGGCGIQCGVNEECYDGTCTCNGEYCDGVCTFTYYSEEHCGACGQPCGVGEKCLYAQCYQETGTDCAGWYGEGCTEESACCDNGLGEGECIYYWDFSYNEQHCGGCGIACPQGQVCQEGLCQELLGDTCSNPTVVQEFISGCLWEFSAGTFEVGGCPGSGSLAYDQFLSFEVTDESLSWELYLGMMFPGDFYVEVWRVAPAGDTCLPDEYLGCLSPTQNLGVIDPQPLGTILLFRVYSEFNGPDTCFDLSIMPI